MHNGWLSAQLVLVISMMAIATRPVAVPVAAQPTGTAAAADSVRRLDAAWARAYATHDTAFALRLFSPDLVVTATAGTLKNREGELADVREAPGMTVNYFRSSDVVVRAFPGAAVVTGLLEWETVQGGQAAPTKRRYTATYVRGGPEGWRIVALHIGRAP